MTAFLAIAWPGLLALAAMSVFVGHGIRNERRRHPKGHYRERR